MVRKTTIEFLIETITRKLKSKVEELEERFVIIKNEDEELRSNLADLDRRINKRLDEHFISMRNMSSDMVYLIDKIELIKVLTPVLGV